MGHKLKYQVIASFVAGKIVKINQTSTVKDIGPDCVQKSQQVVVLSPKFSGGNIQVLFIRITFQYELKL